MTDNFFDYYSINGPVTDIKSLDNKVYVTGAFDSVNKKIKNLVDLKSGNITNFDCNGNILCLYPSNDGMFVGGDFTSILGSFRSRLAYINPDNTLSSWAPSVNGSVLSIAVVGNIVFIGGRFNKVNNENRNYFAAIDKTTGSLLTANPNPNGTVNIIKSDGVDVIYLGGEFTKFFTETSKLIEVDPINGIVTKDFNLNGIPLTYAHDGNGGTYIAGEFSEILNQQRGRIAYIKSDGTIGDFNVSFDGTINEIVIKNNILYAAGKFNNVTDSNATYQRKKLASIDLNTNLVTDLSANFLNTINSIDIHPTLDILYCAGLFALPFTYIGAIHSISGTVIDTFNVSLNNFATSIKYDINDDSIYIGGAFDSINDSNYSHLAKVNTLGELDSTFNIGLNDQVNKLIVQNNYIYALGDFTNIGEATKYLSVFDKNSGSLTKTIPISGDIYASALDSNGGLYIGGNFLTVNFQPRKYFAYINPDGTVSDVNISVNNVINTMILSNGVLYIGGNFTGTSNYSPYGTIVSPEGAMKSRIISNEEIKCSIKDPNGDGFYVGGSFTSINGKPRNRTAYINSNGTVGDWNISCNDAVHAINISGNTVYIGGDFTSVGVSYISGGAILSPISGTSIQNLYMNSGGYINSIVKDSLGGLYLGGSFTTMLGVPRSNCAYINPNGTIGSFDPSANNTITAMYLDETFNKLYVAGNFQKINTTNVYKIAAINTLNGIVSRTYNTITDLGTINSIVTTPDVMYLAGSFTKAGRLSTGFTSIDATNALYIKDYDVKFSSSPTIATSCVLDLSGGLFVSLAHVGQSSVDGISCKDIYHITEDGKVDPRWNALRNITNAYVGNMQLSGSKLYICSGPSIYGGGGGFSISSETGKPNKLYAGMLILETNPISGSVLDERIIFEDYFNVNTFAFNGSYVYIGANTNTYERSFLSRPFRGGGFVDNISGVGYVTQLKANDEIRTFCNDLSGGYYVGGKFTEILNTQKYRIAHIKADGTIDIAFNASISGSNQYINTIINDPDDDYIYAAGSFTSVNGISISNLVKLNKFTGNVAIVYPTVCNSTVQSINISGDKLFVGTDGTNFNGTNYISAIDKNTGNSISGFNLKIDNSVKSLQIDPTSNNLYIAGSFSNWYVDNKYYAITDNNSNLINADYNINGSTIYAIASDMSGGIFLGGSFTSISGQSVNNIAYISSDGAIKPFYPNVNSSIQCLYFDNVQKVLYIGGNFYQIDNQTRNYAAAFDLNGNLLPWNPNCGGVVYSIEMSGNDIYLAGNFTTINTPPKKRSYFAIVDNISGNTKYPYEIGFNSTVQKIKFNENKTNLYVGGSFTIAGTSLPYAGSFDKSTSLFNGKITIDSTLSAVVCDNSGGYYIGGGFSYVNNQYRRYLAYVNSNGEVSDWDPSPNSPVFSLSISGDTLYVGGSFTSISGQSRFYAASFDINTKFLKDWNPNFNSTILCLKPFNNSVYASGYFTSINGGTSFRNYLAKVDNICGSNDSNFRPNINGYPSNILFDSNGTLFMTGSFSLVNGYNRNYVAAINSITGGTLPWYPITNSTVNSIDISGDIIFMGGSFSSVNSTTRYYTAAVDNMSGVLRPWYANCNTSVSNISIANNSIFLAGSFTTINTTFPRSGVAEVDSVSGSVLPWDPKLNGTATIINAKGNDVLIGNSLSLGNSISKKYVSKMINNTLDSWYVNCNSHVYSLTVSGNNIYIGGAFTLINGDSRTYLAGVDGITGGTLSFKSNSSLNNYVYSLETSSNIVYVGGGFSSSPQYIMAINSLNNVTTNFDIKVNSTVRSLLLDNNKIYIGGSFTKAKNTSRPSLLSYNLITNTPNNWNPNTTNVYPTVIGMSGDKIFVLNSTSSLTIDGKSRTYALAYNKNTGTLDDWNPNVAGGVPYAIYVDTAENKILLGGRFTLVNSAQRSRLASVDSVSGNITYDWNPSVSNYSSDTVYSISKLNNTYFIGGDLYKINKLYLPSLVVYNTATDSIIPWYPWFVSSNFNTISVNTMQVSGNILYIGGRFDIKNNAGTVIRKSLAAFDMTTFELTEWNPRINVNGSVYSMKLSGDKVFIAGSFTSVNGVTRNMAACVTNTTGGLLDWNPNCGIASVYTLDICANNILLGGNIPSVNGISTSEYALFAVDSVYGNKIPWNPNINYNSYGTIYGTAIDLSKNVIYLAGDINNINNQTRYGLVGIDFTNKITNWNPNATASSTSYVLNISAETIYIGGSFTTINGVNRYRACAVDQISGAVKSWDPNFNGNVTSISISADKLYIGGNFTTAKAGTLTRNYAACIDYNGNATEWNPNLNNSVLMIDINNDDKLVYIAGNFTTNRGSPRNYLTGVDSVSGLPGLFDANSNNAIKTIGYSNGKVYASGTSVTQINGYTRSRVAAIDINDASVKPWNPNCNGTVRSIEPALTFVYLGGNFNTVNGTSKNYLAAVDNVSGVYRAMTPIASYNVYTMKASADKILYVGGSFFTFAVNITSGAKITSWDPNIEGSVYDIEIKDNSIYLAGNISKIQKNVGKFISTDLNSSRLINDYNMVGTGAYCTAADSSGGLYLGGSFTSISGQSRNNIAYLTPYNTISSWNPNINSSVRDIQLTDELMFVGGDFTSVNGSTVNRFVMLDRLSGNTYIPPISGNLDFNGSVYSIAVSGKTLFIGGSFTTVNGQPRNYTAAITISGELLPWTNRETYDSYPTIYKVLTYNNNVYLTGAFWGNTGSTTYQTAGITRVDSISGVNTEPKKFRFESYGSIQSTVRTGTMIDNKLYVQAANLYQAKNILYSVTTSTSGSNDYQFINKNMGLIASSFPTSYIKGSCKDQNGGFYVCGKFSPTQNRQGVAYYDSNEQLGSFNITVNDYVSAVAISGNILYIGGNFTTVNGVSRNRVAAIDINSTFTNAPSAILPWNPNANSEVKTIFISGSTIYLGGSFTSIKSTTRNRAAAVDTISGDLFSWNPNCSSTVYKIIDCNSSLILAGSFSTINGISSPNYYYCAMVDNISGSLNTVFRPSANSSVYSIYNYNNTLYIGGVFSTVGGQSRNKIAQIEPISGSVTSWNAGYVSNINLYDDSVYCINVLGNTIYFSNKCSFDLTTGLRKPEIYSHLTEYYAVIKEIITANNKLYFGTDSFASYQYDLQDYSSLSLCGILCFDCDSYEPILSYQFQSPGTLYDILKMTSKNNKLYVSTINYSIKSYELTGGNYDPMYLTFPGSIYSVDRVDNKLFVSGTTSPAYYSRNHLAKVDNNFGEPFVEFNPNMSSYVNTIEISGDSIFVGGEFTTVNGISRNYEARLDINNGEVLPFNPSTDNYATTMTINGNSIFIGGTFTDVNSLERNRLIAIDTNTKAINDWNPNANDNVYTLEVSGNTIYIGGEFSAIGSQSIAHIAKVDNTYGIVDPLIDLNVFDSYYYSPKVTVIKSDNYNNIYIGGQFTQFESTSKRNIVKYNVANHVTNSSWNANITDYDSIISVISISGDFVYIGGLFNSVNNTSVGNIVSVDSTTGLINSSWDISANGSIKTIKIDSNKIYIGGLFGDTNKATNVDGFISVDATNSTILSPTITYFNGGVTSMEYDSNYIYLMGNSNQYAGKSSYIAEINTIDNLYRGIAYVDGPINSVALSGNKLYSVGTFTHLISSGISQINAGIIDITDSTKSYPWSPNVNDDGTIVYTKNNKVYIGGQFNGINEISQSYLAKLDLNGNINSSFNVLPNNSVSTIEISSNALFLGGNFTQINSNSRNYAASVDISGILLDWNPNVDGVINVLKTDNDLIYIGGKFNQVNGNYNYHHLIKVKPDGNVYPWISNISEDVNSINISSNNVYVGTVSASTINFVTVDKISGLIDSNNSFIFNDDIKAIESGSNNRLYIGGKYTGMPISRNNVFAFDALNNTLLSWNPNINGYTTSINVCGNAVYIGGLFNSVNNISGCRNFVKVDSISGTVITPFIVNDSISEIITDTTNDNIYIVGYFTEVNGMSGFNYIAKYDNNGNVLDWKPNVNGIINTIDIKDNIVYIGGLFTSINGITGFNNIAALDISGNAITSWMPSFDSMVNSIAISGDYMFVGGNFLYVNNSIRKYSAKVDLISGGVTRWLPWTDGYINSIKTNNNTVYLGGSFNYAGNAYHRKNIVSVSLNKARIYPLDSDTNGPVTSILPIYDELIIGGTFILVNGKSKPYIAIINK